MQKSNKTKKKTKKKSTGLRADFKKAMDSYEDFMDEYCSFMKSYQEDPSDASLLEDYTSYMSKYSDMVKKFDKWESKDLNESIIQMFRRGLRRNWRKYPLNNIGEFKVMLSLLI